MNGEAEQGRVLVSYGGRGVIQTKAGERLECQYRRSVGRPLCGDYVTIERPSPSEGVVSAIAPRRNLFARANRRQEKQAVAANLDQVVIVLAPSPAPSRDLVERYLVAAHSLGINPVLALNKAELMPTADLDARSPLLRLDEYARLGYPVLQTSCKGEPGIEALADGLTNRTSILVGQSGVGKSSLANALLPDLGLQTGTLSRATGKGTHTTTTTMMHALPCGGWLIDSPGVWEYGLWKMDAGELLNGFPDLTAQATGCRFHNCLHAHEPGCSVRRAAKSGTVFEWRYQAYLRLLEQGGGD